MPSGSCHCGAVRFSVDGEIDQAIECVEGIDLDAIKRVQVNGREF